MKEHNTLNIEERIRPEYSSKNKHYESTIYRGLVEGTERGRKGSRDRVMSEVRRNAENN